jgi:hypothetical protein
LKKMVYISRCYWRKFVQRRMIYKYG